MNRKTAMQIFEIDPASDASSFPKAIHVHRDGTFTLCRSYFYRHGTSPVTFFIELEAKAKRHGYKLELIEDRDVYKPWPSISYYRIRVRFAEEPGIPQL